ncbi:tyrosine decarboxylase MfnA [Massilia rubra]|uniref:Tyrosine decarboxylase MfnA n=1 Tax=Massilia rubra TaxID=2607910 RepID=A0ABX0LF91_9BURK|nr:tyrosine decarboxylase MfnA [Massilia rubra]NHZ33374.1 tyrosine decarboxylase MfnA [Massilia rubra]
MRKQGRAQSEVLAELDNLRTRDVPWNRVLNSICTVPHEAALRAGQAALDSNLGDLRIFRGCREVEQKALALMGGLLGKADCAGSLVSGGTEANLLAMYVARKRRPDIAHPEIVAGETVHYSFGKVCDMLGITLRVVGLDERFRMRPDAALEAINGNTIALVGTAGSSEFGAVDPIEELAAIAHRRDLYFHVDAATGGFIIPFARALGRDLPQFDFSLAGVSSIAMDPHKYGMSIIPAGAVFFRDQALRDSINLESFFNATPTHHSLIGTRSGAAAAATYAVLETLGFDGYLDVTRKNYRVMDYLIEQLVQHGYRLVAPPQLNIVNVDLPNAVEVMRALEECGWIISVSKRFRHCLRLVVTHHVDEAMVDEFVERLRSIATPPAL